MVETPYRERLNYILKNIMYKSKSSKNSTSIVEDACIICVQMKRS